jgi:ParB family chromosome partitioning protein
MLSIKEKGLLQPLVVRPVGSHFEVICGHRRLEACKRLRIHEVPCIVQEKSDEEAYEVALIENMQRESLTPIEEAEAFKRYVFDFGWGGISELASRIGKSVSYISQRMLLLNLPSSVQNSIRSNELGFSLAREIIRLKDPKIQCQVADRILKSKLSVRETHVTVGGIKNHFADAPQASESSDWDISRETKDKKQKTEILTLERTILTLRMATIRIGSIIDGCDNAGLTYFLGEIRTSLNKMIDSSVKLRLEKQKMTSLA